MTEVAAAIIKNETGEILICKRGPGGSTAYLWEFPGGKRELGETLQECLFRECKEELRVDIGVGEIFATTSFEYPEGTIHFTFFEAVINSGKIIPIVHEEVVWASRDTFNQFEFCPADIDIIRMLK